MTREITIGSVTVGGKRPLLWIVGPCVIESREHCLNIAEQLCAIFSNLKQQLIFKSSYDKANRTSVKSFRGVGIEEGLRILDDVRSRTGLPVTTDVHDVSQAKLAGEVCDLLQIPAFLARQTDLLVAAGKTGKAVNVKKGQFMSPWDMKNVAQKLVEVGNQRILLTERGTTFGYGMLVNDMRAIPWMQETDYPVIFDATHSVQMPGALGDRTGGDRRMVPFLARAATAAGSNGIFLETHPDPDHAPSDGPNMLPLDQVSNLVQQCAAIDSILKNSNGYE